jgi:hypothetical protein
MRKVDCRSICRACPSTVEPVSRVLITAVIHEPLSAFRAASSFVRDVVSCYDGSILHVYLSN